MAAKRQTHLVTEVPSVCQRVRMIFPEESFQTIKEAAIYHTSILLHDSRSRGGQPDLH
jgi:hypothetical protein